MNITDIAKVEPKIENGKLIIYITCLEEDITDLRLLNFITNFEKLLDELSNESIKEFYFVFNINDLIIPTNFTMLKDFADMFVRHRVTILDKLQFTVVESKSNIFKLFFGLFKKHYVPIKPLYLCMSSEDVKSCIFNPESRSKYPNIINMIEESNK